MEKQNLSLSTVQQIILNCQLLFGPNLLADGKAAVAEIIDRLGYIQIDTIAVIKRAHHHSLWVRNSAYDESMLHELQAVDRRVFEYWAHAMAYVPMADYRYYLPKMENFRNPNGKWVKDRLHNHHEMLPEVLRRIRDEGPLSAKDFEAPAGRKAGTWWDWKPAKLALELLFWQGELMITERRKFQKIYDLRERVLPPDIDTSLPGKEEIAHFLIRRALSALGVASKREILNFMQPGQSRDSDMQIAGSVVIQKGIDQLVESGEIIPLMIDSDAAKESFVLSRTLDNLANLNDDGGQQIYILSPFDNLLIQRSRMLRLFQFDYALECYLPAAKRKFGYFVLPVLRGNRFIARLDAKADRKLGILQVKSLHFEAGLKCPDEFAPQLVRSLKAFAAFNDCPKIHIEKILPAKFKSVLKSKYS